MTQPKNSSSGEFWYDEAAAERAVDFFATCLTHTKGEWRGKPLVLAKWQSEEIIKPLFGWKRADGTRRYRTLFALVPRKAGKSTISAGIALYLLFCDDEPAAEIFGAASDRLQAGIIFEMAKEMILASAALRSRCKIFARSIAVPTTGSSYRVVSSDAYSAHGFSPSGIIFDELHTQPNRELYDALTTGMGARRQPLTVAISTGGYERTSLCFDLYDHARKVRDGVVTDNGFLPVIHEAPQDADWTSPDVWRIAHPGIGISTTLEYLAAECAKAKQLPAYENNFRRFLLNQWTEQENRWFSMGQWDKGIFEYPELEGREGGGGLDLSRTTDFSAFSLAFPVDKMVHIKSFFWLPEDGLLRRRLRETAPFDVWVRAGLIMTTPGATIDYDIIRRNINEIGEECKIQSICFDPWNASQIVKQLEGDGFKMVPMRQGFVSMNAPTKEFERLVLAGQLNHGGNAVLRWMADNVCVDTDPAGNLKPNKEKSSECIDGIVSGIMALAAMGSPPEMYDPFFTFIG